MVGRRSEPAGLQDSGADEYVEEGNE